MLEQSYLKLAKHYQNCLIKQGDTSQGMGWPKEEDNLLRFKIMSEIFIPRLIVEERISVLDFGCGTSHFYGYLMKMCIDKKIVYTGLDILSESIAISKNKYPNNEYLCLDVLNNNINFKNYDYIIINGLFTQKRDMKTNEMKNFFKLLISFLFKNAKYGLAFNTMSENVDYRKKGAFHMNHKWATSLITKNLSRNFVIRHDYGLYENTFYIYKDYSL